MNYANLEEEIENATSVECEEIFNKRKFVARAAQLPTLLWANYVDLVMCLKCLYNCKTYEDIISTYSIRKGFIV